MKERLEQVLYFKNLDQALKDIDATSKAKLDGLRARMEGVEATATATTQKVLRLERLLEQLSAENADQVRNYNATLPVMCNEPII